MNHIELCFNVLKGLRGAASWSWQNSAGTQRKGKVIYYASFCRLAQQPSEGDDGGHAGTVEEEERGHTLEAESVVVVGQIVRRLALDVQKESAKPPGKTKEKKPLTHKMSK